jgi:hypothetical protein
MDDSIVDRLIGLCLLVVGGSVLFFAIKLRPGTNVLKMRKTIGMVIAAALILYGLYSLILG